jgi:hypothetical protein
MLQSGLFDEKGPLFWLALHRKFEMHSVKISASF